MSCTLRPATFGLVTTFGLGQGFLNYGSQPQMGSLSKILWSSDFNSLQNRIAVIQVLCCWTECLWYVLLSFIKKFEKKEYLD